MEEKTEVKIVFTTTNLDLTTYLKYLNHEFDHPPEFINGRVAFYFPFSTKLEHDNSQFINRQALCEPQKLLELSRTIKAIVWDLRRGAK